MSLYLKLDARKFVKKNDVVRESIRHVTTRLSLHRQSPFKKNIILFSCRRSGSTWLGESLGAEPGLRFVNDPLRDSWMRRKPLRGITLEPGDRLVEFDETIRKKINDYLGNIRYTRLCSPYDPFKPNFHLKTDRVLIKNLRVNPVIEHFLERSNTYQFLWLMRHPIPTILSSINLPRMDLMRYIEADNYREQHLSEELINFLLNLRERGNNYELWAAEWALDQLAPWKVFNARPDVSLRVSYEQLSAQPVQTVEKIAKYLNLKRPDLVVRALRIPSASTRTERLTLIEHANGNELVTAWKKKVSSKTIAQIFRVIDRFGIDYYTRSEVLPNQKYLLALV